MNNLLNQEELKQALIDSHLDPWFAPHRKGFKAGYDYALSKLSVSDEKLVEIIGTHLVNAYLAGEGRLSFLKEMNSKELLKELSPYLTLQKQEARKEGTRESLLHYKKMVARILVGLKNSFIDANIGKILNQMDEEEAKSNTLNKDGG